MACSSGLRNAVLAVITATFMGCVAIPGATNTPQSSNMNAGVGSGNVVWGVGTAAAGATAPPAAAGTWAVSWQTIAGGVACLALLAGGVYLFARFKERQAASRAVAKLGA